MSPCPKPGAVFSSQEAEHRKQAAASSASHWKQRREAAEEAAQARGWFLGWGGTWGGGSRMSFPFASSKMTFLDQSELPEVLVEVYDLL